MKTATITSLSILAIAMVAVPLTLPTLGRAQEAPQQKLVSLEVSQVDVRDALRQLFRQVGISYAISPEVLGTVTLSLKNVTFEVALQNLVRQVDATYRVEGGVYIVARRHSIRIGGKQVEDIVVAESHAIPAVQQDGDYLFIVDESRIIKVRKRDLKTVGTASYRQ